MVKSRQRNRLSTKRASIVPTNHESMAEKVTQTAKANREERKTNRSNPVAIYSSYLHFVCIYFVALENIVGLISSKIDSKNEEQQLNTKHKQKKSHTNQNDFKQMRMNARCYVIWSKSALIFSPYPYEIHFFHALALQMLLLLGAPECAQIFAFGIRFAVCHFSLFIPNVFVGWFGRLLSPRDIKMCQHKSIAAAAAQKRA